MPAADELEVYVGELQRKFDRLKVLYEQYFLGIEKTEPMTIRKEVTRGVVYIVGAHTRSTSLRFKIQSLIQKWNLYQSYWNRTMREIEQGRYVRHVAAAKRRAEQAGVEFPAEAMGVHLVPSSHSDPGAQSAQSAEAPAAAPPGPLPPPVSARSLPPPLPPPRKTVPSGEAAARATTASAVPGYSEDALRDLHRRVVAAQRSVGEAAEMRFETLVAQLSRQVPKLITDHGCKAVAFDVVTKDGKVKLKPSPVR